MKKILIVISILSTVSCQSPSKNTEELSNLKTDPLTYSDTLWTKFISFYEPIKINDIKIVDSLYQPIRAKSIPAHLVSKFIQSVPADEVGYVLYGYKAKLSNNLLALISIWQSDTVTFIMDIFDSKNQKVLTVPINKFYRFSSTSFAYRTEVFMGSDTIFFTRQTYEITDPEFFKSASKIAYTGILCLRKYGYSLKTNKEMVILDDCKNTKFKQIMEVSLGLTEVK